MRTAMAKGIFLFKKPGKFLCRALVVWVILLKKLLCVKEKAPNSLFGRLFYHFIK